MRIQQPNGEKRGPPQLRCGVTQCLHQVILALSKGHDYSRLFERTMAYLEAHLPAGLAFIAFEGPERGIWRLITCDSEKPPDPGGSVQTRKATLFFDPSNLEEYLKGKAPGVPNISPTFPPGLREASETAPAQRSVLSVPLGAGEKAFGILVAARQGSEVFQEEELECFQVLGDHLSFLIYHTRQLAEQRLAFQKLHQTSEPVRETGDHGTRDVP